MVSSTLLTIVILRGYRLFECARSLHAHGEGIRAQIPGSWPLERARERTAAGTLRLPHRGHELRQLLVLLAFVDSLTSDLLEFAALKGFDGK